MTKGKQEMNETVFPKRARVVSGSALKTFALVCMIVDHVGAFIVYYLKPIVLFTVGDYNVTLYRLMRWIGRPAFPIYVFLLVEGYLHTRDRVRYGANLFAFALISELPWNLAHSGSLIYVDAQNVFFTLFLGYVGVCVYDAFEGEANKQFAALLPLIVMALLMNADYGVLGFGFILMTFVLRGKPAAMTAVGCGFVGANPAACLAFIPINMYNGKRGFIKGRVLKYLYYAVYPAHMLALYFVHLNVIGY